MCGGLRSAAQNYSGRISHVIISATSFSEIPTHSFWVWDWGNPLLSSSPGDGDLHWLLHLILHKGKSRGPESRGTIPAPHSTQL